jgi:MFS family permease
MDPIERDTYRLHTRAAFFEGAFGAVLASVADVARKGLGADTLLITLITMAPAVTQCLAIFATGRIAAAHPRRLIRWAGILGRLPLLILLIRWDDPWLLLILVSVQALSMVPIISAWNGILRSNYTAENRGRIFGRAARYQSLAGAIAIVASGIWAERDPEAFRYLYPFAGIVGAWACVLFASVPRREGRIAAPSGVRLSSAGSLLGVLRRDANFRQYQIGFFFYGMGFMALATAKPFITVDVLELDWAVLLGARAIPSLAGIALSPYFGQLLDRIGQARLGVISFGGLVLYGIALSLADDAATFCAAELLFGISMTGVTILWNMGPIAFAREGEAMQYMAIHVALVGVRGMLGHPVGGLITEYASDPRWVILFCGLAWLSAAMVMRRLGRRMREGAAGSSDARTTGE